MANTKVTGSVIADGTITAAKIASGALDSIIGGYLTTNTYATEGYVTTAVNNLIDAAPASLDTLNELAAALNDDANFATTVTNSLATKLNLSGGTLTGNLGLGIAPSSWVGASGIQVQYATIEGRSSLSSFAEYGANTYSDSGTRKYIASDFASRYTQYQGTHYWLSASSGNAGDVISFSELMRITPTGNVGIGTSSPSAKLTLDHSSSPRNYQIDFIGNSSSAKGHAGQFANGFYLSSNWYYNGGQYADDYSKGQAAIILSAADTTNSKIQFSLSSAGDASPAEKMRIDASGNVLVGLTSRVPGLEPYTQFEVSGNEGGITINSNLTTADRYSRLMFTKSGGLGNEGLIRYNVNDYHMSFWTDATEHMRITSAGNVGIGTTNADKKFTISDASTSVRFYGSGNDFVLADPISSLTRNVIFNNSGSGGLNVLVGKTSNNIDLNGVEILAANDYNIVSSIGSPNNTYLLYDTLNNRTSFYVSYLGTIYARSTSISSLSDERLKENIKDLEGGLDTILSLKPRTFDWKDGSKLNVTGFIAQEVELVKSNCVDEWIPSDSPENETPYKTVRQDFIPEIVKAIQEQQDIINNLKAEIETLKSQINA